MRAIVNDTEFQIFFNHFENQIWKGSKTYIQRGTECVVRPVPESEDAPAPAPLGIGTALCSGKDNFDRVEGRKLALARALKEAKWDKPTRTQVWQQYARRCRLSRNHKIQPQAG